jgi:protease-4
VFSAEQALAGGLVDDIGYLDGTIARARAAAGVTEARVIRYRRADEFADDCLYSRAMVGAPQFNLLNLDLDILPRSPNFLYLWSP